MNKRTWLMKTVALAVTTTMVLGLAACAGNDSTGTETTGATGTP